MQHNHNALRALVRQDIAKDLNSLFDCPSGSKTYNGGAAPRSSTNVNSILDNSKLLARRLLERDDFIDAILTGEDLRQRVTDMSLPLGVQKTLLRSIEEKRSKWGVKGPCSHDRIECSSDNSYLQDLLSEWREGSRKPEVIAAAIEILVKKCRIDSITARSAIARILKQSAATIEDFDELKRVQAEAKDFCFHSIAHVVIGTNGREIELVSCSGQRLIASQTLLVGSALSDELVPVGGAPFLYWRSGGDGNNFSFEGLPPDRGHGRCSFGELGGTRPVLVIGGVIRASIPDPCDSRPDTVVVLEVDAALGVAVYPHASDEILSFCVLVEGRLVGGNCADAYELANNDTASEVPEDGCSDSDSSRSYSDNEDVERLRGRPAFLNTVEVTYFVAFCVAYNGKTTVSALVSLQTCVLLDQLPVSVTMSGETAAVVSGTNGLLVQCSGGAAAVALVPDGEGRGPHHCIGSCVCSVAVCEGRQLLCSGDDQGKLCVFLRGELVASTLCCSGRVKGLWLCDLGDRLAVALFDRLMLYSVDCVGGSLLLRATLDCVGGRRAEYAAAFLPGDGLRIWRVLPSPAGGVNLTCWTRGLQEPVPAPAAGPFDSPSHAQPSGVVVSSDPLILQLFRSSDISLAPPAPVAEPTSGDAAMTARAVRHFAHGSSAAFSTAKPVLAVIMAHMSTASPSTGLEIPRALLASALDATLPELEAALGCCGSLVELSPAAGIAMSSDVIKWLGSRPGREFWVDVQLGHSLLTALFLRYCSNKSVAVESPFQAYLAEQGPGHLRRSSRALREATRPLCVRKIDETANIRHTIPPQLGYVTGLQEIYARRVGLCGCIPAQLGQLTQLRVLSMGNNRLTGCIPPGLGNLKHLQRIVLHQNNLIGSVPEAFKALGCIVNVAGNRLLEQGADVPDWERRALADIFAASGGRGWLTKAHWCSSSPVHTWYKVGVLHSNVHSIVMSSNNMDGCISSSISQLSQLRMIELATMPLLTGPIPRALYALSGLRRLCICRCGLTGRLAAEIGNLAALEELQLFGNRITGLVPPSLSKLVNLKLLSLGEYTGGNDFDPQPLPPCIQHMLKLEALFMANCNLVGPVPSWIGSLAELRQLDLQRNSLGGQLPDSLSQLSQLLYLNLKDNEGICGALPVEALCCLKRLNRLSLVHCSFSNVVSAEEELARRLSRCKVWI